MKKRTSPITEGSGNVFADLGFANPEQEQLKAHLTLQIYRTIKQRGLTQTQAGAILGVKQPHVSGLMRGRSGNFSVGRLMEFLTALGQDVEIAVRPSRKAHGEMSVTLG
jgi:predicted XRE-type DNA-binding protein